MAVMIMLQRVFGYIQEDSSYAWSLPTEGGAT